LGPGSRSKFFDPKMRLTAASVLKFGEESPDLAKDPQAPNRLHIHVVVRTPNGNDYGKDLRRQHLLAQPH